MFGKKQEDKRFDREFFTIYDSKSQSYRAPVLTFNHLTAVRDLENVFRDRDQRSNPLVTNAEDHALFRCGYFDLKTGEMKPCVPLEHIVSLHDIKASIALEPVNPGPTIPGPQIHPV